MKTTIAFFLLLLITSCNKEKIQQNAVVDAMTSGQWKVVNFVNAGTNVTTDFATYKFQFKENLTVDAINNTTVEKTGSWNADANARTITSNFNGAINPL
ncbi:MAG: hypothetical protein V4676_07230, partial [Bacteroidota bacterium]